MTGETQSERHDAPWLRRQLGSGLLTPQAKDPPVTGETPDSRPTKAEDIDTAL